MHRSISSPCKSDSVRTLSHREDRSSSCSLILALSSSFIRADIFLPLVIMSFTSKLCCWISLYSFSCFRMTSICSSSGTENMSICKVLSASFSHELNSLTSSKKSWFSWFKLLAFSFFMTSRSCTRADSSRTPHISFQVTRSFSSRASKISRSLSGRRYEIRSPTRSTSSTEDSTCDKSLSVSFISVASFENFSRTSIHSLYFTSNVSTSAIHLIR